MKTITVDNVEKKNYHISFFLYPVLTQHLIIVYTIY